MNSPSGTASAVRGLLSKYRSALLSVGLFSIFFNILMLTIPFYMLNVFTRVLTSRSIETLTMLTIAAGGALIVQGLIDMVRSRVLVRVGAALDSGLGRRVLDALVRGKAGTAPGAAGRLHDVTELRNFLSGPAVLTIFDVPFVPVYVAVIYLLAPELGMVALIGSVLLFIVAVLNERTTRRPMAAAAADAGKARYKADDYIRNSDAIQSMGMVPAITGRWQTLNNQQLTSLSLANDRAASLSALAKFVRMTLQIAIFAVGAYLFTQNALAPGAMIAAAILMARALAPVEGAITSWKWMVSSRAAYDRLKQLLADAPGADERMSLPKPKGRIDVERIIAHVPGTDRMVLKGVSFALPAGEMLGIIGPSGAGKTTVARAIVGVAQPRLGTVRLDGADIYDWDPDDLGRHIGYVPQDMQLFAGTVAENIARMQVGAPGEAVVAAAKRAGVNERILRLPEGYDTDVGEGGRHLSAGLRQHVALARALYGDPRVLVLDEPNSNMDSESESALMRAMVSARQAKITLIVVSHRPSLLENADKLLVLRDGAVDIFGPRDAVMARVTGKPQPATAGGYPKNTEAFGRKQATPLRAETSS